MKLLTGQMKTMLQTFLPLFVYKWSLLKLTGGGAGGILQECEVNHRELDAGSCGTQPKDGRKALFKPNCLSESEQ